MARSEHQGLGWTEVKEVSPREKLQEPDRRGEMSLCQVSANCRTLGDALHMSPTLILKVTLGSVSTSQQRCLNLSFSSVAAKERWGLD